MIDRLLRALRVAISKRPHELVRAIGEGREVVGSFLPLAPPAEIVEAAGAIPWRLLATGGADADLRGMGLLGRDTCSFCRSVVGQAMLLPPPVTAIAAGAVCDRLRRAADALPEATGLPVFTVALPRTREDAGQREDLAAELRLLARELSARTGVDATEERLAAAIARGNRVRSILAAADAARREEPPRLTGSEFLDAVRAAQGLESEAFLAIAGGLPAALAARDVAPSRPLRILLVGPTIPDGRREVVDLVEDGGRAVVVADLTDSGSLGYGRPVEEDGDPFLALADQVLAHPILAAPLKPADALRRAYAAALAAAEPHGVLFRGAPFCRPWNAEVPFFREECPVPFLDVRVDAGGSGQLRTRVGAFLESLAARRGR